MNGIDDCVTSWKKSDTFKLWDGVKNSRNGFVVHYKAEKPCNQCEKTFMKFAKYVGIQIDKGQNGTHKIHDDN